MSRSPVWLCLLWSFAASASPLDATMHPVGKPGVVPSGCAGCTADDSADAPRLAGRARERGAPEYADPSSRDDDRDAVFSPGIDDGGAVEAPGASPGLTLPSVLP